MTTYKVVDNQTGSTIKTFKSREAATKMADRKDSAYGAVRFLVIPVFGA